MDTQTNGDAENGSRAPPKPAKMSSSEYHFKTFQTSMNLLSHLLTGLVVGVSLTFAFSIGQPTAATPLHVVLCVLGYQLLMTQAILSLSPDNNWSAHLKLVDKRRAHWILQLLGSGLAIAGSFIKILDKNVHWNTLHGQFALVALVFTVVSLVNGLTSLWAYELRFIPAILSKLTHICFGIVGFVASGIALCYGFEKGFFRNWTGDPMGYAIIGLTAALHFLVIITPLFTFYAKIKRN